MSAEDPRENLGESKMEALQRLKNDRAKTNQKFENWNKALEAYALGWKKPKPYYPVIISPSSLVSTPQKLQEMAGMATPPRVLKTTYTTLHGGIDGAHVRADGKPEEVQVGEIGWDELVEITDKAECDEWLFVFVDGKVRRATLVKSFKNGDENAGEQEVGGGTHEIEPGTTLPEMPLDSTI